MKRVAIILIAVISLFVFLGCEKKNPQVTIEMAKGGNIVIELLHKDAPKTVDNFLKLVNKKFYDGLTFHRVIPDFLIQGGDPRGDGTGTPGYKIKFEASDRKHLTGAVAMTSKSSPDSAGCQFHIILSDQPSLDGKHTVFGHVISGMDVVTNVQRGDIMKRVYVSAP